MAEVFAFTFNTLLCDMAAVDTKYRDEILEAQKSLLDQCVCKLELLKAENPEIAEKDKDWILTSLLPGTLGLCRALGRYGMPDDYLITRVFPTEPPPPSPASQMVTTKQSFSNFR